ncbi:MAG: hypothetical protein SFU21_10875 [Flavihumibacter sp.]|nr:hypothetical protein [Flavihumibacter sp.]
MPTHYIEVSKANSFRWIPVDPPKDARHNFTHIDLGWFKETILKFETQTVYAAKFQQNDYAGLQVRSTLGPVYIKVLNCQGQQVYDFAVPTVATSILGQDWQTYEKLINFSSLLANDTQPLPEGEYYFLMIAGAGNSIATLITEPVQIKQRWPETALLEFSHDVNDYDVAWETGIKMHVRVEAIITEMQPKRLRSSYEDQTQNITTLRSVPYRKFKLKVGGRRGVPPYMAEKINFALSCRNLVIEGLAMVPDEGAEIEMQYTEGWPLPTLAIDMREAKNTYSSRILADGTNAPAVAMIYNIDNWTYYGQFTNTGTGPVRIVKTI